MRDKFVFLLQSVGEGLQTAMSDQSLFAQFEVLSCALYQVVRLPGKEGDYADDWEEILVLMYQLAINTAV